MDFEIIDEIKTLRGILMLYAIFYDDEDDIEEYSNGFTRDGYVRVGFTFGNKVTTSDAEYKSEYSDKHMYQTLLEVLYRKVV